MNSQRLSLSSSVFADRIKKFDAYQHNSRTSRRVSSNSQSKRINPVKGVVSKTITSPVKSMTWQKPPMIIKEPLTVHKKIHGLKNQTTQNLALGAVAKSQSSNFMAFSRQFNDFSPPPLKVKKSKWQIAFYSLGLAVFILSAGVSVQTLLTNGNAREQLDVLGAQSYVKDEQGVTEGTGSDPSEESVSAEALANYRVAPDLPRYLRIPEIGVFSRIKHTGLDSEGSVDSPWNIHDVSWFREGTVPGNSSGSSLLLGHVSGWSTPGVFKNIGKLKPGSRFEIEKGNGEKIKYEVTKTEIMPLIDVNMGKILAPEIASEHDIKLMTCSGKYNRDTKSYEDRTIVYAKVLR